MIFAVAFLALSVLVLSRITGETTYSSSGQLFAQPRFWPAVGLLGMVGFGLGHLLMTLRERSVGGAGEVRVWLAAVEYLVWFMVYVALVPIIGYLLATLAFTGLLALRQGYRRSAELLSALGLGLGIVLIFKTGLAVKIPGVEVYEFLPTSLRSFMITYF